MFKTSNQCRISAPVSSPLKALFCALALAGASISATAAAVHNPLNGHLYEVVLAEGIGWDDARAAALARGPGWDLVSIGDAAESAFVKSLLDATLSALRSHFWIGATERAQEGDWRWVDGTPFSFTDWAPSEPNNFRVDEDLLAFDLVQSGWAWNDAPDDLHARYGLSRGYVVESVPTPATLALLCAGLLGLRLTRRPSPQRKHT